MNVPRDAYDKILGDLHLTPIKSILRILNKLDILSKEEIDQLDKRCHTHCAGTVIYDVLVSCFSFLMKISSKANYNVFNNFSF